MEKITSNAKANVEFSVNLRLTPGETKALIAISSYGTDHFLKIFYEKMGTSSLKPNEKDFRALLEKLNDDLPREIEKIEAATKGINEALKEF